MRIIGGRLRGRRLEVPQGLPVRPTTDQAKEALFNILEYRMDLSSIEAIDLFAGTGNLSYELASRGVKKVTSVDSFGKCIKYIAQTSSQLGLDGICPVRSDVFAFLNQASVPVDLIVADPPYDLDRLAQLPAIVLTSGWLKPDGMFILEYPSMRALPVIEVIPEIRTYGSSSFALYKHP